MYDWAQVDTMAQKSQTCGVCTSRLHREISYKLHLPRAYETHHWNAYGSRRFGKYFGCGILTSKPNFSNSYADNTVPRLPTEVSSKSRIEIPSGNGTSGKKHIQNTICNAYFHFDILKQAHAKICTVCGKVVRDMRKHRLIHTGEKPFQCDRCSYRCARSSSLKRHLATHLNAAVLPQQSHLQQPTHGTSVQPSNNLQPPPHQQPQQQAPASLEEHKFSPHLALPQVILPQQPPVQATQQQPTLPMHNPQEAPHTLLSMHPAQEHETFDPNLQYRGMKFAWNSTLQLLLWLLVLFFMDISIKWMK